MKNMKVKVTAAALALVCAASSATAISVFANDSSFRAGSSVSSQNIARNFLSKGKDLHFYEFASDASNYDWNYGIDSLNVKVSCDYDYSINRYDFTIKGVKPGRANVRLMYVDTNNQWQTKAFEAVVDSNLKVSLANSIVLDDPSEVYKTAENTITKTDNTKKNTDFTYECHGAASYGYDWTYSIDSLNVQVSCDYDFSDYRYTFNIKGIKPGTVNAVLQYVNMQDQWVKVPMVLLVDENLNVTRTDPHYVPQKSENEKLIGISEGDAVKKAIAFSGDSENICVSFEKVYDTVYGHCFLVGLRDNYGTVRNYYVGSYFCTQQKQAM